ncbi:unnamed protein product [Rotaria sp. Silwood1]|nr:unnamed protein product [Rotaria sp. Silwood1]CAF1371080.1 unnamed protein product [Rotaria sp. Silwood1]CAF3601813.1 unnamed protein product [Rotaria sp. Silwood1]CAF4714402.1 unnamed protein product [Rotaria sp. Silwood1]
MSKSNVNNISDILEQHACVTLNMTDCLRLIRFPASIIDVIRQVIITNWPRGLNKERQDIDFYEFKLYGNPWWDPNDDAILSRILMIHILSALYKHGWYLLTSTQISKRLYDKDSLIFQLRVPQPETSFFAISFNDYDKLRLICVPHELIPLVQQTLGKAMIQREAWCDGGKVYQFKLHGNPWIGHKKEAIISRIKLLSLLDCFNTFGWKLYASIDISQGDEGRDTDSWVFRRDIQ